GRPTTDPVLDGAQVVPHQFVPRRGDGRVAFDQVVPGNRRIRALGDTEGSRHHLVLPRRQRQDRYETHWARRPDESFDGGRAFLRIRTGGHDPPGGGGLVARPQQLRSVGEEEEVEETGAGGQPGKVARSEFGDVDDGQQVEGGLEVGGP